MPVTRADVAAMVRLLYPDAPPFAVDHGVDALIDAVGSAVTTADRLPQPAPASAPHAPPTPAEGQVLVEVADASEREWPDSGVVLSLTLFPVGEPDTTIRCRFDQTREVVRGIAMRALGGLADGESVSALIGRRATVETRPYTGRDGVERLGVAKWITPRKPRTASTRPPAMTNRKPEMDADDGDIPF
jgi:hypothetical protein